MKKIMFFALAMCSMSIFSMDKSERPKGKILTPLTGNDVDPMVILYHARKSQRSPSPAQDQRPQSPAPVKKFKFSEEETAY